MQNRNVFTVKDDKITEIVCVLDKSGSMSAIRDDTIGSFNTFLKTQQEMPDKALFTLMLFDDEYEMLHNGVDINCIEPLTSKTYKPSGTTALFDALGVAISKTEKRFNDEKCNRVLVAVITDGQENASKEYNKCQIMKLIKEHEGKDWEFVYLSASPSAFTDGSSMGFKSHNVFHFQPSKFGIHDTMRRYSAMSCSYRSSGNLGNPFESKNK